MRAYRLIAPGMMRLQEIETPTPREGDALIRVHACGVCGTDLHLKQRGHHDWRGDALTLGHEIVGEIVQPANRAGEWVVVDPQIVCGACFYCRRGRLNLCEQLEHIGISVDGGFADYLRAPLRNLYRLPEGVAPENRWQFALVEPVATCVAAMNLANPRPDESVAVVGLGFFGQVFLQLARLWGVQRRFGLDPLPQRREVAQQLSQAEVFDPSAESAKLPEANVVIDAAGSPTAAETCVRIASKAGRIIVFGYRPEPVQLDWYAITLKELTVVGSRSSNHAWEQSLHLVASGLLQLRPLVHLYAFDEADEAFRAAEQREVFKPILLL
ncbi:MAG: alcohol dehydrogenase catalytic domain-containing protein [Armatimonadota bacterium]